MKGAGIVKRWFLLNVPRPTRGNEKRRKPICPWLHIFFYVENLLEMSPLKLRENKILFDWIIFPERRKNTRSDCRTAEK
jgi:hypothetical protein